MVGFVQNNHVAVQVGARRGGQRVEICQIKLVANRKIDRLVKGRGCVLVVSEHERAVDHDPGVLEHVDRTLIIPVLETPTLAHLLQAVRVQRFESDQRVHAAAASHQPDQFRIAGNVDGHLAGPRNSERPQCLEQLDGPGDVDKEVVVHQEDESGPLPPDLVDHLGDRPLPQIVAVEGVNRTEVAVVSAAAAVLHQR